MSHITLEAQSRSLSGKGASRRLRRLENKIPAIIYGGTQEPVLVHFAHNKINKAMENEAIYASVLTVKIDDNQEERVILKALQRHPWKALIMHMDFQRVNAEDTVNKIIPVHYINEDKAPGVKAGGIVSHHMVNIEVHCQVKDLPEFITVDLKNMQLDDVLHLSHLSLPQGVQLTADVHDAAHDLPVVSIHKPKAVSIDTEAPEAAEVPRAGEETDAASAE